MKVPNDANLLVNSSHRLKMSWETFPYYLPHNIVTKKEIHMIQKRNSLWLGVHSIYTEGMNLCFITGFSVIYCYLYLGSPSVYELHEFLYLQFA